MNELNYTTLEASQRLVAAGIVLETDFYWFAYNDNTLRSLRDAGKAIPQPYLITKESVGNCNTRTSYVPAPSMAEVWRELPEGSTLYNSGDIARAYMANPKLSGSYKANTNPTDALIDLLIWVRKEAEDADKRLDID